jgi:UDP-glucose 4-epimerase
LELRGERVVVTGGAGFIGSHVVDRLVEMGADTVVVDDLSVGTRENLRRAEGNGARFVLGDVRDGELLEHELKSAAAVIHMACDNLRASLSRPFHTHEANAGGTLVTALAAVRAGVRRFAYVSSCEAYGSGRTLPMTEDHPLEPTTVYGASKAAGELYAQACMRTYGIEAVVIRPFNSYGPREHASGTSAEVIPKFATRILAGRPPVIFGDGSQTRDFTWVEETAEGIVRAAASDALVGEAVNIAYGRPVAIRELARLLLALLDAEHLVWEVDEARPGDVLRHHADTTRAREALGFEASVPIEEGLARYVEWVRATSAEPVAPQAVRNW